MKFLSSLFLLFVCFSVARADSREPQWVQAFKKEAANYKSSNNQIYSSLAAIRSKRLGNCVAHARLAASYAMAAGWRCEFVDLIKDDHAHRILYASKSGVLWAVSGHYCWRVQSLAHMLASPNLKGYLVYKISRVSFSDLQDTRPCYADTGSFSLMLIDHAAYGLDDEDDYWQSDYVPALMVKDNRYFIYDKREFLPGNLK